MPFEINNQGGFPVDLKYCRKLLKKAFKNLNLSDKNQRLSIAFVDNRTIRRLNRIYRGVDQVTDVLAYNLDKSLPRKKGINKKIYWGEILISYPMARRQAKRYQTSIKKEIGLLILHGLLHLKGYDHQTARERIIMEKKQERILEGFR